MKLIPMGDYYVWYCDWCDSRNLTMWTRVDAAKLSCGCCHKYFAVDAPPPFVRNDKRLLCHPS